MRGIGAIGLLATLTLAAYGQTTSFDVVSVKASQHLVGPDYNNQLAFSRVGVTARNVTLRRLIAEAYRVQMNQVIGPRWLDQNEYDIQARAGSLTTPEKLALMFQSLLTDRFQLKQHRETKNMRVYELVVDKAGPKIQPVRGGQEPQPRRGPRFYGDTRQLADLIAVQLNLPAPSDSTRPVMAAGPAALVLDRTGLAGIYDFDLDARPEMGADGFTTWQRILQERLGLKLNSRRGEAPVIVVDEALRIPTEN